MKKIEWYREFVDKSYVPAKDDLKVLFYYEPEKGISDIDALGRIASESSVGTWTTLSWMPKRIKSLKAKVYEYDKGKGFAKIAYPLELWEKGSVAQLMSGIGGNIFGMKALRNLRLVDAELSSKYLKGFKGPVHGTDAIKNIFKRKKGPVVATVPKPKVGFSAKEHAEVAYQMWLGGNDCVKDDENLSSQVFNRFDLRVKLLARNRDRAEKQTGEIKDAFINVTAPDSKELERRIELVHSHCFRYFMIDVVLSGFTALQTACELARERKMAIHGHRAMHAMMTRNPKHGMTMLFLSKLCRLIGVDQIHTGTLIGKLAGDAKEVRAMKDMLLAKKNPGVKNICMPQDWGSIKPTMPVVSGGLHPGIVPEVLKIYGTDSIVLQVGGGVMGHPKGVRAGARSVRAAIEAYHEGISLEEKAKSSKELAEALRKWSHMKPV